MFSIFASLWNSANVLYTLGKDPECANDLQNQLLILFFFFKFAQSMKKQYSGKKAFHLSRSVSNLAYHSMLHLSLVC